MEISEDFLYKQYGCKIKVNRKKLKNTLYTRQLLKDLEILFQIPFYVLSNKKAPQFRSVYYPIYTSANEQFIEALLDNLIVEVTNAVTYIIINEFSFIYDVRKNFYRSTFLSLRNVERFRNNLSWQLRIKRFLKRPADLYNSQQGIWVIRTTGIYYRIIYANRSLELLNLNQFAILTLITIEIKDFLVSRFDETVYLFGSTVRYTLTSVFGQLIGLVWRGIIEGLKK